MWHMMLTRKTLLAGLAALVALLGIGALMRPATRAPDAQPCAASATTLARLKPLVTGEVAAFQLAAGPKPLPPFAFAGPDGKAMDMAAFKGRTVLLNLWATWCIPCRKEMPALNSLQAELGGPGFEVVAINIDTRNLERPRQWLAENGIDKLAYYSDAKANVFQDLRAANLAIGMPTTILVDAKGCGLGVLHGAAEWASADAKALIRAAMAP
jgi:thiol-disulfide isomerase/thioredoxin